MKSSAIDCSLHSRAGDDSNVVCMAFGNVSANSFTTTPALTTESKFDTIRERNLKKITWKAIEIKLRGKKYALKRKNPNKKGVQGKVGEVYDYESYIVAKEKGGNPILKGNLEINKKVTTFCRDLINNSN